MGSSMGGSRIETNEGFAGFWMMTHSTWACFFDYTAWHSKIIVCAMMCLEFHDNHPCSNNPSNLNQGAIGRFPHVLWWLKKWIYCRMAQSGFLLLYEKHGAWRKTKQTINSSISVACWNSTCCTLNAWFSPLPLKFVNANFCPVLLVFFVLSQTVLNWTVKMCFPLNMHRVKACCMSV